MVSSTGATGVVLHRDLVERVVKVREGRPIAFLDLALPHDVDPTVRELDGVTLVDLVTLQQVHAGSGADDVEAARAIVTEEVGGSALFAARFRECAARALLLPRRDPGRRSPLWQQRQRASQLLDVARKYPSFPIVLETVREVLQDVYDLPALMALTGKLARQVKQQLYRAIICPLQIIHK